MSGGDMDVDDKFIYIDESVRKRQPLRFTNVLVAAEGALDPETHSELKDSLAPENPLLVVSESRPRAGFANLFVNEHGEVRADVWILADSPEGFDLEVGVHFYLQFDFGDMSKIHLTNKRPTFRLSAGRGEWQSPPLTPFSL